MQATATTLPPLPPLPPAPASPGLTGVERAAQAPAAATAPLTARGIEALKARRSELSRQLTSAEGRRSGLAKQLLVSSGPSRAGLEQRIGQLDQRIMQIEADIADVGRQLSNAPAQLLNEASTTQSPSPFGLTSGQATGVSIVFTIFVLFPLALAFARLLWKRGTSPRHVPAPRDSSQQLERLEQAVDAIAIEVERVSEGQRFVTQLLTRGAAQPAIGVVPADPIRARVPDRVGVSGERE